MDAIRRLIENSPHLNAAVDNFEPDWDNFSSHHLEMVLAGVGTGARIATGQGNTLG